MNYEETCAYHAKEQGVTAIVDYLAKGDIPATIEQTGGFCMLALIQHPAKGYAFVGTYEEGGYNIGTYENDDEYEPSGWHYAESLPEVATIISAYLGGVL